MDLDRFYLLFLFAFLLFVGGVNLNSILLSQYQAHKATFLKHRDITFYYVKQNSQPSLGI